MPNLLTLYQNLFAPPRHLIPALLLIWAGLSLSESQTRKRGEPVEALSNLVFYAIVGWLVGGRLVFAALNPQAFIAAPLSLVYPNPDLFHPLGADVVGLGVAIFFGRKYQLRLWPTLDALTPLFALTVVGVALSQLAAGTIFGSETSVPWAVTQLEARRHPYLVYTLLASLLTLGLLWPRMARSASVAGSTFLAFAGLTSGWMLFLEAFRGDSTFIVGGLRLGQVLAFVALAASLYWLDRSKAEYHSAPQDAN